MIVSLIYLGLQIRSQTVEARITGLDNAVGELNNIYESLSGDEKLAAVFHRNKWSRIDDEVFAGIREGIGERRSKRY